MPELLKNLYSPAWIEGLAQRIAAVEPKFKTGEFTLAVMDKSWDGLELKQRTRHISKRLGEFLPGDFTRQLELLQKATEGMSGYVCTVFPDFIEVYGIDMPDTAIPALEHFTTLCTSEFAVRPFLLKYYERMLGQHLLWAESHNEHVRRLASEGIRSRLPWGMGVPSLKKEPEKVLPVLKKLINDPSEYVRRSVANNLNDISKDHPELVLKFISSLDLKNTATAKLAKHALRGLLKAGNQKALDLFGFHDKLEVKCHSIHSDKKTYRLGSSMIWEAGIHARDAVGTDSRASLLRLEYRIHFFRPSGRGGAKIFQLSEQPVEGEKRIRIKKKHSFQDLTTRKHFAGPHKLELLANGKTIATLDFELTP